MFNALTRRTGALCTAMRGTGCVLRSRPAHPGQLPTLRRCLWVRESLLESAEVTGLFTAVAALQLIDRGLCSCETLATGCLELQGAHISPAVNVYQQMTPRKKAGRATWRSGRPDPTLRSSRQPTFSRNLRTGSPIFHQARDVAPVIAAMRKSK